MVSYHEQSYQGFFLQKEVRVRDNDVYIFSLHFVISTFFKQCISRASIKEPIKLKLVNKTNI